MSLLPAEVHAELNQLLQALQSPDNNIRSQAEDHLANNWTATRPELLLVGLAEQTAASTDAPVRLTHRAVGHVPSEHTVLTLSSEFPSYDPSPPSSFAGYPPRVARMTREKLSRYSSL